jgi:ElaB/YqjD/DUF883 family membrane-anchored ribosome-binding protein
MAPGASIIPGCPRDLLSRAGQFASLRERSTTMDLTEVTQLIDDLKTAVDEDPEAARQKVADLKAKIQTLPPDEQAQIKGAVAELKERAQNLPPEQQAELADIVSTIRG